MTENLKKLTVSENIDLALAEIERIEKSLTRLHKILDGDNEKLQRIQAAVSAMRGDLQKLHDERQAHEKR